MQQDKEEQLLKKRLTELAGLCWQRDIQTHSGFLTLREQTVFHSIERELAPVRVQLAGGYPQAERNSNAANYEAGVALLSSWSGSGSADDMATRLWFDQKTNNPSYE